ncbi:uncharacterized protein LOC111381706 [Olea europaea var. sylvestris]|uniref:uncharacterized protein LOC111381706 n=1 Tax=Olea europaea var. sylvestris TaxID=158386 RepID=UPI000C1CEC4D|nr:uncharacterized protein LOC111381706 [Olea europaea var. sylvestris]
MRTISPIRRCALKIEEGDRSPDHYRACGSLKSTGDKQNQKPRTGKTRNPGRLGAGNWCRITYSRKALRKLCSGCQKNQCRLSLADYERVWVSVQNGWKPPSTTVSGVVNLTDISLWTKEELADCNWNSKGLHALFMSVSPEEFKRVSMCETAKEDKDDESFDEFYAKLNAIVNSSFNLGEGISEPKIVRKVLRSLPERFRPKVTAIEESKDLDTIKIEELVGSFQTYELTISQPRKNKSIALNIVWEGESESSDMETLRDEEIAYFGSRKALTVSLTDDDSNLSEQSDSSSSEEEKGYMASVSTVKSESDKKSEKIEEEVESNKFGDDSEDETDIHEAYQLLFKESLKIKKVNKALFKKVDELERENEKITYDLQVSSKNLSELKYVNEKLEDTVKTLTCELEKSNTQLQSFVSGTKKLDDLLGMNKPTGNRQGLRFVKSDSNVSSLSKTTFVPASNRSNVSTNPESKDKNFNGLRALELIRFLHLIFIINTHVHLNLGSYPLVITMVSHLTEMVTRLTGITLTSRKVWVKKSDVGEYTESLKCFVAHVAYKTRVVNKALFSTFDDCNGSVVTFGDGATAPIQGKGSITIAGLPPIFNVLYVEGLKSNLLSISQICDADYEVSFVQKRCTVYDASGGVVLEGVRTSDNCYGVFPNSNYVCSSAKIDMSELWHQRLDHVNYRSLSKLVKKKIVDGLPKIDQSENAVCKPCQQGKQFRINHKRTSKILTNRALELLHMDLMGPSRIDLLREKSGTGDLVKSLCKRLKVEQNLPISRVRSDHGKEFENFNLENFCLEEGIKHEFFSPITPQQNEVVERKNRVLQEMARAMLHGKDLAMHFWGEAINTACHIINRIYLRPKSDKTPYEIRKGKKPIVNTFGCLAANSVLQSVNIVIDDAFTEDESAENGVDIEDLSEDRGATAKNKEHSIPKSPWSLENISEQGLPNWDQSKLPREPSSKVKYNHPKVNIIGDLDEGMRLRKRVLNNLTYTSYISQIKPKKVEEALRDECWVNAMHEELNQFVRNNVWNLVPRPDDSNMIGTKWIFKNKIDNQCTITRNKARLVVQGYTQVEGVDFDETFAPVARLESIRILLVVACTLGFKLYQMDVNSTFLNGILQEEALTTYFVEHGFSQGGADRTLFIRLIEETITVAQIYVDDIIFGSPIDSFAIEFAECMKQEFEMSMVGELSYFLGLQVKQTDCGLFIS